MSLLLGSSGALKPNNGMCDQVVMYDILAFPQTATAAREFTAYLKYLVSGCGSTVSVMVFRNYRTRSSHGHPVLARSASRAACRSCASWHAMAVTACDVAHQSSSLTR